MSELGRKIIVAPMAGGPSTPALAAAATWAPSTSPAGTGFAAARPAPVADIVAALTGS